MRIKKLHIECERKKGDVGINGNDDVLCEQINQGKKYLKDSLCVKTLEMHKIQLNNNGTDGHAVINAVFYELPQM